MESKQFEGSVILEQLAEIGKLEEFFAAVDSDDFKKAKYLMRLAEFDDSTIEIVLTKMAEADNNH